MRKTSVAQFDLLGNRVATYGSLTEASKSTGVSVHNIWSSANFIRQTAGKFTWRYVGNGERK